MATQVQLRGGTTSEHSSFTGAAREVTVDTDKDVVVVHDGSTAGGIPLAKEASVLPLAGGTMTGNITLGTNTIDGLEINTTATSNIGLGTGAVDSITTGDWNVGVGDYALTANTTGNRNTASGFNALLLNTTGSDNTAIGWEAMQNNVSGFDNTAVGKYALILNNSGAYNTALGVRSLYNNTAHYNTATGHSALYSNTTGANNTANGYQSLYNNTTASYNTANGYQALYANTTGTNNTATGSYSLVSNTTGASNTALGYSALNVNTTGYNNVASGYRALYLNTTGSTNTSVGRVASYSNTTGASNTAVGEGALYTASTGSNNTALGKAAGDNITTGSSNIIIGSGVDAPSATASNQLNIGNWITGVDGNIGIGVVPKTWSSNADALQVGDQSAVWIYDDGSNPEQSHFSENVYSDASSTEKYIETDFASDYYHRSGVHNFRVAPSGTAGAAISWTTAMTIDNAGAVGIGTTTPASMFKVHIKGSNPNLKTLKSEVISTGDVSHFYFDNPNGTVGSIGTSGTATAYYTSSDYRLKENVLPMLNSIDRLKTLKPVRFNFITDDTKAVDGFLAHEAQSVVPECVKGVKDEMMDEEYEVTPAVMDGETVVTEAVMGTRSVPDYQGIDQSKLVPLLVASLQEAIARIEVLENA